MNFDDTFYPYKDIFTFYVKYFCEHFLHPRFLVTEHATDIIQGHKLSINFTEVLALLTFSLHLF